MSFEKLFKLKDNPFRMVPASSSGDLIWAGFPDLKMKFESRIVRSCKIQNSSIVLNWGEYGSGKTHAARYFNKQSVLHEIASSKEVSQPYSLLLTLPKGKNPIYEIYIGIIDRLVFSNLRDKFSPIIVFIKDYIKTISDNIHIQNVLSMVFTYENDILIKKYLYNNISSAELKELSDYGIFRNLDTESDQCKFLSGLFSCITYKKEIYSCVNIWIDEFEDIALMNNTNIDKVNNFLRELFDNTPNNLLLFLNLTQSAMINIEDLGEYLSEAIRSRIKERINFEIPNKETINKYLEELLNHPNYRTEEVRNKLTPFTDDAINAITEKLGDVSLRRYNEAFSLLLEISELEGNLLIDKAYFEKNSKEILGWKD